MLTTFEIGPHNGRVCFLTTSGEKHFATIECPNEKVALRAEIPFGYLKVGGWVRIRGTARIDASVRKDGTAAEKSTYYHQPHDGSNKNEWVFKQLVDGTVVHIGSPEFTECMREAMLCLRRHLDSWERNLDVEKWEETASVLEGVLKLIQEEVEERKPLPVKTVSINL
jgi:hypothetical protein